MLYELLVSLMYSVQFYLDGSRSSLGQVPAHLILATHVCHASILYPALACTTSKPCSEETSGGVSISLLCITIGILQIFDCNAQSAPCSLLVAVTSQHRAAHELPRTVGTALSSLLTAAFT